MLTDPRTSCGSEWVMLTGYKAGHWSVETSQQPTSHTSTTMPASRISICSGAHGSFVLRESNFNRDRFVSARDDLSRPYPKAEDVYLRSDNVSSEEEFADLGLSDFFIAHRRVVRCKLDCLQLTALQVSFSHLYSYSLSHGHIGRFIIPWRSATT